MCTNAYSDTLPRFGVTSCLSARDILPSHCASLTKNLPFSTSLGQDHPLPNDEKLCLEV